MKGPLSSTEGPRACPTSTLEILILNFGAQDIPLGKMFLNTIFFKYQIYFSVRYYYIHNSLVCVAEK